MAPRPGEVVRFIARSSKRIAVTVVGGAVLVAGLAMLVLPGPAVIVIPLGLAILGTEYAWAAAAVERSKRMAAQAGQLARDGVTRAARDGNRVVRSAGRRVRRR